MFTIFRYSLGRMRGQILGWGLSLAILGGYLLTFYDVLFEQGAEIMRLVSSYPPELLTFFGDMTNLMSPAGYLTVEFFSYMPLIVGIFAVLSGSGLLAGDEEAGTLDLLLSYPISRMQLFAGRWLAFVSAMAGIVALSWLGLAGGLRWSAMDVSPAELALPCLSLWAQLLVFGCLGLLLSMVLPSRRLAAMTAGLVLVASFFLTSLARIDASLEEAARFSPLNYYQAGEALDGMNWVWFLGLVAVALVLSMLAAWRFQRRDIRVGGEGSWGLGLRPRKASAPPLG